MKLWLAVTTLASLAALSDAAALLAALDAGGRACTFCLAGCVPPGKICSDGKVSGIFYISLSGAPPPPLFPSSPLSTPHVYSSVIISLKNPFLFIFDRLSATTRLQYM
jgi:hypothetical protein